MADGEKAKPREQAVSLIELFYDLVYVYAIAKMTSIFTGAELVPYTFFRYLIASFAVLQAWMYMTNYINRFGRERWYENVAIAANMGAAVFMSNTISEDWSEMLIGFNASMFAILGIVAVLYALRLRGGVSSRTMAGFALKTLLPVCAVYLAVALVAPVLHPNAALALDTVAILYGIFGPALVNRGVTLDLNLISFPHLAERFELITIITFGETVVTVAEVAEVAGLGLASVMTFASVVLLFSVYVTFMHGMLEHHQVRRGLRMLYCHFFIVIAVNLYTVALNLLVEEPEPTAAVCAIAAVALVLFFGCLFAMYKYRCAGVEFSATDWAALAGFVLAGCGLCFAGIVGGVVAFLAGPLVASAGCFCWLLHKDKSPHQHAKK